MADILIRGVPMPVPDFHTTVIIMGNGDVFWYNEKVGTAVPLPEGHGDLIDRDALKKRTPMVIDYSAGGFGTDGSIRPVRGYGDWQIDQAPTIVPAEGVTYNG